MNYTWDITQMHRNSDDGFVTAIHYSVVATDGEYTSSTVGALGYSKENISYIPYNQLTKNEVIGWLQEKIGKEATEENLKAQINLLKNPVSISGLPW
jgi:hypothetical protein